MTAQLAPVPDIQSAEPFVISRSGRQLTRHCFYPSMDDAAWQMAELPRFTGSTTCHWTVLKHSVFVYTLARQLGDDATQFLALIHDVHEIATGDIPTPFKTDWIRALQSDMDHSFWSLIGFVPTPQQVAAVKSIDNRAMRAEGELFLLAPTSAKMADAIGGATHGDKTALLHLRNCPIHLSPQGWKCEVTRLASKLNLHWS